MVGKKSSVSILKRMLLEEGLSSSQFATTAFMQGVTYRWGVAWTFSEPAALLYHTQAMLRGQSQRPALAQTPPGQAPLGEGRYTLSLSIASLRLTALPAELALQQVAAPRASSWHALQIAFARLVAIFQLLEAELRQQHYFHDMVHIEEQRREQRRGRGGGGGQAVLVTAQGSLPSQPWQIRVHLDLPASSHAPEESAAAMGKLLLCRISAQQSGVSAQGLVPAAAQSAALLLALAVHVSAPPDAEDGHELIEVEMRTQCIECSEALAR
jgi:hypothetical protein